MVLTRRAAKEAAEKAPTAKQDAIEFSDDTSDMSTTQSVDIDKQLQETNNNQHSSKDLLASPGQYDRDDGDDNVNQVDDENSADSRQFAAREISEPNAASEQSTPSEEGRMDEVMQLVQEDLQSSEDVPTFEESSDQKYTETPADTAPKSFDSRQAVSTRLHVGHALAFIALTVAAHGVSSDTIDPLPVHALVMLACIVPLRLVLAVTLHGRFASSLMPRLSLALNGSFLFASNALHLIASRVDQVSLSAYLVASASQIAAAWFSMTVTTSKSLGQSFIIVHSLLDTAADIFLAAVVSGRTALQYAFRPLFWIRIVTDLIRIASSVTAIICHDEEDKKQDVQNKTHVS